MHIVYLYKYAMCLLNVCFATVLTPSICLLRFLRIHEMLAWLSVCQKYTVSVGVQEHREAAQRKAAEQAAAKKLATQQKQAKSKEVAAGEKAAKVLELVLFRMSTLLSSTAEVFDINVGICSSVHWLLSCCLSAYG